MASPEESPSEFHMMGSDPSKELILTDYDKKRKIPKPKEDGYFQITTRTLATELCCPICLDLLTNTMTTKECLHRFCAECITTALLRGNKECPSCRKKLVSKRSLRPDPNFDALIAKIWPDRRVYEEMQSRCDKEFDSHGVQSQSALSPAKRIRLSPEGEAVGGSTEVPMEAETSEEKDKEEPNISRRKSEESESFAVSRDSAETIEALEESPEGQARREAMERLEQMDWPEEEEQRKSCDSEDWKEEKTEKKKEETDKEKSKSPKAKTSPKTEKDNGKDDGQKPSCSKKNTKKGETGENEVGVAKAGDCTCTEHPEIVELELKDGKIVLGPGLEILLSTPDNSDVEEKPKEEVPVKKKVGRPKKKHWKTIKAEEARAARERERLEREKEKRKEEVEVKKEIKAEAPESVEETARVSAEDVKPARKEKKPRKEDVLDSEAEIAAYEAMQVEEIPDEEPLLPEGVDASFLDDLEAQLNETQEDNIGNGNGSGVPEVKDEPGPSTSHSQNGGDVTGSSSSSAPTASSAPLFSSVPDQEALQAATVIASLAGAVIPPNLIAAGALAPLKMPLPVGVPSSLNAPLPSLSIPPNQVNGEGNGNGTTEGGPSDPPSADSSASPATPTTQPIGPPFPVTLSVETMAEIDKETKKDEEMLENMDDDELLGILQDCVEQENEEESEEEEEEEDDDEESLGEDSTDRTTSSDGSGPSVYSSTPPGSLSSSHLTLSDLTDSEPSEPPPLTPNPSQAPSGFPPNSTPSGGKNSYNNMPFVSTVFPPLPPSGYPQGLPPGLPGLGAPPFAPPELKPSTSGGRDEDVKPPAHTTPLKDRLHRWLADHPEKPPTPDQRMHEPLKRTVEEDDDGTVREGGIGHTGVPPAEDWSEIEVELLPSRALLQREGVCPDLITPRYIRTRDETTMEHVAAFIHQKALEDAQARQSDFDAPPVPDIPKPEHFFAFSAEGGCHVRRLFLNETLLSASSAFMRHEHLIIFFDTKAPTLSNPRSVVEMVVPEHFLSNSPQPQ